MKADTITKAYVKDADIFADIFNFYIYGGRQVIQPEKLTERDSTKIALPYGADDAVVPIQKFRDVQKLYAAMTDGKSDYVLYSVESQKEIHYAMPVKNNLYDALEYAGQVEEAAKSHRKELKRRKEQGEKENKSEANENRKTPDAGEFLSGFWKQDRLIPSITVTIFFGAEEWDGPLSLADMMDVTDPEVLARMDNYHVHLIAPAQMADEEIMKFQSSLREVMLFIKYSKDRENLDRILKRNERRFREMERRAADVIQAITNSELKYKKSEVKVNMCQAIAEMRAEERRLGQEEGRQEMSQAIREMREEERRLGQEEGRREMSQAIREMREEERRLGQEEGRQDGERNGELRKAKEVAGNLNKIGLDIEKIAQSVGCTVEVVKEWLQNSDDDIR